MLDVFRPSNYDEAADPMLGLAVAGRYHVRSLMNYDGFSFLYIGNDITDNSTVGIRIAINKQSHGQMLQWLAQCMLTTGKHAILAIGHLDETKIMYVVLAEAALDILREKKQKSSEPPLVVAESA
jgi:hypothetical protein